MDKLEINIRCSQAKSVNNRAPDKYRSRPGGSTGSKVKKNHRVRDFEASLLLDGRFSSI